MEFLIGSCNFGQKSKFWSKIQILVENPNFGQKSNLKLCTKRSGKSCAAGIRLVKKAEKLENGQENGEEEKKKEPAPARPERLKMRLSMKSESGTKEESSVIRQPKGPESVGVKGFGKSMSRKELIDQSEDEETSDQSEHESESLSVSEGDFEPAEGLTIPAE